MKAYLIRRMLLVIPSFIGISLVTFLIMQLLPGNPIFLRLQAGQGAMSGAITQEVIQATKEMYGLDKPIPVQYVLWLSRMVRMDFGHSYKDNRPITDKVIEALPVTLQINVISLFLIYLIAVPLGVFSATHQRSRTDSVITIILFVLYSLPNFWVAMLLIYFLGGGLVNWFPVSWLSSVGAEEFPWYKWLFDRFMHLVLPVFCLTYGGLAALSRYARAGMIEVIRQDYIRTARAYGFSEKVVVFKYAMRNSLIPIITLLGTLLPTLIAGSVIIETIFSLPGLGKMIYEGILSRDYPLVMGILTMTAFLTMIGLIVSDILYAIVDPRIRFE